MLYACLTPGVLGWSLLYDATPGGAEMLGCMVAHLQHLGVRPSPLSRRDPDALPAQDDRDRAAVLDRCAPACLRFVAGLDDGAAGTQRSPSAPAPAAAGAPKLALVPCTPRSVLPYRRSFSSPDSPLSPCFLPTGSEGFRGAPPPALREAAARAWASRGGPGGPAPQGGAGDGRDAGEWAAGWGPAQIACCLSAAWFRERLAANCSV